MTRTIAVADPDDPRLAVFRLHDRALSNRPQRRDDAGAGLFLAEGDLVVERSLAAGCVPVAVLVDATRPPALVDRLSPDVTVFAAGEAIRAHVTNLGVPSPIVAVFERPARATVDELSRSAERLVVVEAVDNPANVGAIVRNAAGLGWHGLILDHTSADPLARRALRVSMGQGVVLPHARTRDLVGTLEELVTRGFTVVALDPAGAVELDDAETDVGPAGRVALVVGSERAGLSEAALAATSRRVRIPMARGVDSLNVAAATAVACYVLRPRP